MFGLSKVLNTEGKKITAAKASTSEHDMNAIKQSIAYIEFMPDGTILYANPIFLDLLGYTLDEIQGEHHRIFCDPQYVRSENYREFWRRLANGESFSGVFDRYNKQHDKFFLRATYFPVKNRNGEVIKVIKLASDITQNHQALVDKDAILSALHRSLAVIEFTPEGHIIWANDNFLKTMGYSLEEIQGQHHRIFCYDIFYRENPRFWDKLNNGESFVGRFERKTAQDERVWLEASYNPILDAHGHVYKVIKFASDITTRVENAKRIADIAVTTSEQTSQITHNASEVLTETVNNAERITTQVQSASEIGSRLHEHAKNISAMIGTIDAIASQTNILALNAAIEAARAGESGRGFSVVAEEVRKLALSTSAATQKITHMVEDNSRLIEQMYQQLDQINQFLGDEREKIHDLSRGFSEINSGVSAFVDVIHRLNV
ncbi:PAS domain-containing methyl-accepting chemotaxis protein [Dickeya dadantii]|nr:PAS domain-containing methyl-accepting chemotaxis protein [Dickeya dadantii]NAT79058.1 hypothetical protein [Dickeya dadantii]NPE65010.1 PAS domain-containing methyl-accepting chemotaxis protein [Dickeya dadantii]